MSRRDGFLQWPFLFCLPLLALIMPACGCRKQVQAGPPPPPPEVAYLEVKIEAVVLKKELPGRTTPYLVAEIRPQASGIIRQRLFTEGSDVKAGDILYEIDAESYIAARDNAEAAVLAAKADQATAVAVLKQAEAALIDAEAAQNRAEANAEPLRLRYQRYFELLANKAVSQQDYDDIASALKRAESGIESAKAAVVSANADILRAQAAIQAAEAAVAHAEAGLKVAVINLSYTKITAPISGRIGRSAVTTGALVTAHQPVPLAIIQQLDPIYVDVPQATAELLQLQRRLSDGRLTHNGSTTSAATLLLEDNTAYPLPGALQFRDVTVDPTTG
ncbi:MAG TPA: biotin/lipoyl-binding protein, partial [Lentisphaeria bacterium]|nr:biotin/lipoyl-binding protein [Lentisphaeria bacterium]